MFFSIKDFEIGTHKGDEYQIKTKDSHKMGIGGCQASKVNGNETVKPYFLFYFVREPSLESYKIEDIIKNLKETKIREKCISL